MSRPASPQGGRHQTQAVLRVTAGVAAQRFLRQQRSRRLCVTCAAISLVAVAFTEAVPAEHARGKAHGVVVSAVGVALLCSRRGTRDSEALSGDGRRGLLFCSWSRCSTGTTAGSTSANYFGLCCQVYLCQISTAGAWGVRNCAFSRMIYTPTVQI